MNAIQKTTIDNDKRTLEEILEGYKDKGNGLTQQEQVYFKQHLEAAIRFLEDASREADEGQR